MPREGRGQSPEEKGADPSSIPGRLQSSPGLCPALPAGRSNGTRNPEPHRVAAAQCARLPFSERPETGPAYALVRTPGRTRVPGQELSQIRQLSASTSRFLEGAEEFFLLLPIDHAGYQ